jgi:hypothetical protein
MALRHVDAVLLLLTTLRCSDGYTAMLLWHYCNAMAQ